MKFSEHVLGAITVKDRPERAMYEATNVHSERPPRPRIVPPKHEKYGGSDPKSFDSRDMMTPSKVGTFVASHRKAHHIIIIDGTQILPEGFPGVKHFR